MAYSALAMIYQLLTILYWLVLSIWVGSTFYVAYAAPIVFGVIRRREVRLPEIQGNALRDDHGTLLAGDIVAGLLGRVGQMQVVCMVVMLPLLILLCLYAMGADEWVAMAARWALYITACILVLYNWRRRFPLSLRARQQYIDHADEPEVAEKAKAAYEASQRAAERSYQALLFVLLGLLLVSANPTPRASWLHQRQHPMNLPAAAPAR